MKQCVFLNMLKMEEALLQGLSQSVWVSHSNPVELKSFEGLSQSVR